MPKSEISARAKRVWQRMVEWYGTRVVEQYGESPPLDWCRAIDRIDNPSVTRGLAVIRKRHMHHPPTLPEFEQAMQPEQAATTGPNIAEQLCAFAMKQLGARLTPQQVRGPWSYFGNSAGEIAGVRIPSDGDHPGYCVKAEDLARKDLAPDQIAMEAV